MSGRKPSLTGQAQRDAAYLHEYEAFGASAPITVGECLYKALIEAHGKKDFEVVAHLQLRLFAEMVMCFETFGAMLLAYSRWDKTGGILATLLEYRPGDVPKFIKRLNREEDTLRVLCFPEKETVVAHFPDSPLAKTAYNDKEAKKMIMETCDTYAKEIVRDGYNKIKHAGLWISHPCVLFPSFGKVVTNNDKIYLINYSKKKRCIEPLALGVRGEPGIRMAQKSLNNIDETTRHSKALAGKVADFLEQNLLRPSVALNEEWEKELEKRVSGRYGADCGGDSETFWGMRGEPEV